MTEREKGTRIRKQPGGKVKCQGCGEELTADSDLSSVEYVKTKRGSEYFFHSGCLASVWKRKIS